MVFNRFTNFSNIKLFRSKYFKFILILFFSFFLFNPLDSQALNIYFYGNNYSNLGRCSDLNWCVPNDTNTANIIAVRVEDTNYQIIADSKYQANQTFKVWNKANNFSIRDDLVFYAGAIRPNTITYNAKNSATYDDFGQTYIVNYGVANEFTSVAASTGYFYEYYFPTPMQISRFEISQWDIINTGSTTGDIINNSTNTIINNNNQNTQNIIDNENKNHEEAEESRKGIWDTIKELPSMFLDMLLGLFIPEDFSFLDNFKDALENKLGFIAEIPISVLDFIINLANASWEDFDSISFPSIEIFGVSFWNSQEISLQPAIEIFEPYKYITDILCVILCVNTLLKWYHNFSNGGGK